jgi:predicted HTH transcriptional regulator
MEHVGRGIKQMRDLMKNHGLDEPDFFENNDFFKVVFKSNYILNYSNGLNDRQIKFLRSEKSQITISQYQKMFNVSRNTAIRDLNKLEEENFVIKSKNGRINIFKIISDVGIK